jgi:hypothetical protein
VGGAQVQLQCFSAHVMGMCDPDLVEWQEVSAFKSSSRATFSILRVSGGQHDIILEINRGVGCLRIWWAVSALH